MMTREEAKNLTVKVKEILKRELKGIEVSTKGGTFDDVSFTLKVQLVPHGEDGKVIDKSVEEFKKYGDLFGFSPSDLGIKFSSRGEVYEICGLNINKRKFPVIVRNNQGKRFGYNSDDVLRLIGKKAIS